MEEPSNHIYYKIRLSFIAENYLYSRDCKTFLYGILKPALNKLLDIFMEDALVSFKFHLEKGLSNLPFWVIEVIHTKNIDIQTIKKALTDLNLPMTVKILKSGISTIE